MKPAPFDYVRADDVAHVVATLAEAGGDGKIIAGGQSLMPMINFRLVRPSVLVDINRIAGLDTLEERDGRLVIGALVRHYMTRESPVVARRLPLLRCAMGHVAHLTVRNRGTFCGSICHADPAAELPLLAMLLDARIRIAGPAGNRDLAAGAFFVGALATALEPDEMVIEVDLDVLAPGTGWGFREFARRHGDYALAAVAVVLARRDGRAADVRVALTGVGEMPMRLVGLERALQDSVLEDAVVDDALATMRDELEPTSDLHASADYRRHLAGVLTRRALRDAWERAAEGAHP